MRSFREKYEVTVLPSHMLDSDLGDVVEAYDSKADRSWGCMVGWWLAVLAGLGLGIYNIYDASQRDARLSLVEQILPFAILAAGIIVHFVLLSRHNLCQRIFVCRQGVQWEKYNRRSGRISQSRTVYWEQVGSVVSKKIRRYTSKSKGDDISAPPAPLRSMHPTELPCLRSPASIATSTSRRNSSPGYGLP